MPPWAFEFEDVSVVAGDTTILDHVTAKIRAGVITVLVGPSGAGKSTLLRLCNRLEVPTSGVVRYRGEEVAALDPLVLRRRVAMVFQRPTLFAGSVRDNLHVAAPGATDADLTPSLERVGLGLSFLDRVGDELSGGEQQRACLARSLLVGPEAILMDEPTSSLDEMNAKVLETHARELVDDGVTIVWVTHDRAQAARIADDVLRMEAGRVDC